MSKRRRREKGPHTTAVVNLEVNRAHGEDRHGPGGKFRHNEAPSVLGDHSRPNGRVDANLHFCRARVHVRSVHRARVEEARSWEKNKNR